jgi:hypothetical protein
MSGTERAAYRPLQGRDRTFDNLPSNFDRGRYTPGLAADFSDDPLPKFLSELHDYPLNRIEERKRIRFLKPALIAGLLVSAFAILLSVFGPNDMSVLADKARGKFDDVTKDLRAALTVLDHPEAARRSPVDPARESKALTLTSVDTAQATVGTASRGNSLSDSPPQIPSVNTKYEGAPAKVLDAQTLAALMTRAKKMLAFGDISSARLLLERAATAQDASAAFLLAKTYDPVVLGVRDTRSITPDPELARDWYRKAARLGSVEAQQRLTQLQ